MNRSHIRPKTHRIAIMLMLLLNCIPSIALEYNTERQFIPIITGDIIIFIPSIKHYVSTNAENITDVSADITWSSPTKSTSELLLSTNEDMSGSILVPAGGDYTADTIDHRINLTGLTPETDYYYRVESLGDDNSVVISLIGKFTTGTSDIISNDDGEETTTYTPDDLPTVGETVNAPYWINYIRKIQKGAAGNYTTTFDLCESIINAPMNCRQIFPYPWETHTRRKIGDWQPFYSDLAVRPGYSLPCSGSSCSAGPISSWYWTNWYLQTDEYYVDAVRVPCMWSDGHEQCKFQVEKRIWPGEYRDGWGIIPMSDDILNTLWMTIVPPGKQLGVHGYITNFPTSIEGSFMRAGGVGVPPKNGSILLDTEGNQTRTAYEYDATNDVHRFYVSGWCTDANETACTRGTRDFFTAVGNTNQSNSAFSDTTNALIRQIQSINTANPNARIDIESHSLGAFEVSIVQSLPGLLDANDSVIAIAPPYVVPEEFLIDRTGGPDITVYSAGNDLVSNAISDPNGYGYNQIWQALGVDVVIVNTSPNVKDAHDRCRYLQLVDPVRYPTSSSCW